MKPTSGKNWKKYIFQYIEEIKQPCALTEPSQ